jgi:hypothetical protein
VAEDFPAAVAAVAAAAAGSDTLAIQLGDANDSIRAQTRFTPGILVENFRFFDKYEFLI